MTPAVAKRLRLLASLASLLVLLLAAAGGWFYWQLRASRPQLEGMAALPGLGEPVTVTRDALGVPTIHGANRADVARALGYLHAQDRFFQMDTLRRRAAGELAEIVGKAALPLDQAARVHGFRRLAQTVLAHAAPEERALVEAYAAGVNAGLAGLGARPFEYIILRAAPQPWRAEDCVLVIYAMTLDLQESTGRYEHSLLTLRDKLGSAAAAFFAPLAGPDDAAIDDSKAPAAPMPTARQLDVRKFTAAFPAPARRAGWTDAPAVIGSNSFALAGGRTASGSALLADDMHLDLRVPNTWYRASLEWPAPAQDTPVHKVTGVTLPGVPLMVAGSNGSVAWGFTNAYADTSDLVVVQLNATDPEFYVHEGKVAALEDRREKIRVKGGGDVDVVTPWTVWGPVVGTDEKGRPLALHWVAHDPEATNLALGGLETARNVDEAVAVAHRAGMPAQNFLVAGADGRIAWTIAGRLPRRFGHDGRFPVPWFYGDRGWHGLLPPEEVPVVLAAPDGQLWSANNRMVGGPALAVIGDGGYDDAPRARQIRDDLAALTKATPRDLLTVQLDERALFLARWQKLLLATLAPGGTTPPPARAALRALVEKWEGHASIDSVSYRLVRTWRLRVASHVFTPLFAPCVEEYPQFDWTRFHYESALWTLLQEKPAHLLDPAFANWEALLLAAADEVVADLERQGVPLAQATWGRRNTMRIQHPLAAALPGWLAGGLRLPADALPGDSNMPRVQGPAFGASERMVVSPGREAEGIFEMPGGESGHPLSPFYRAGHAAWARGDATPFLPGKTEHTLELRP